MHLGVGVNVCNWMQFNNFTNKIVTISRIQISYIMMFKQYQQYVCYKPQRHFFLFKRLKKKKKVDLLVSMLDVFITNIPNRQI